MNRWWHCCPGLLTPDECQGLLSHILVQPGEEAKVEVGGIDHVVPDRFQALVRPISRHDPLLRPLLLRLDEVTVEANIEGFGFDISLCQEIQLVEFGEGGHWEWHTDMHWITPKRGHRKLVVFVPLTAGEEYEGGVLELDERPAPDPDRVRQQGTATVIPSFLRHRVTPVLEGTCHYLVAWCDGPLFR